MAVNVVNCGRTLVYLLSLPR